jgi:hypothetical protein
VTTPIIEPYDRDTNSREVCFIMALGTSCTFAGLCSNNFNYLESGPLTSPLLQQESLYTPTTLRFISAE